jgi:hypothetical protein
VLQYLATGISLKPALETWRKKMTRYYKVDSRNMTFMEYWRISSTFKGFLRGCIHKIFRLPMMLSDGIPEPTTFADRIAQKHELPPHLVAKLDAGAADFVKLGFGNICYYDAKNKLAPGETAAVNLLHESGEATVSMVAVKLPSRERMVMSLASLLEDGKVMVTTNRPSEFDDPPGFKIERIIASPASHLWQRHAQRLAKSKVSNPPRKFSAVDAYEEFFEVLIKNIFEHYVERGLWVEMTHDEIAAARKRLSPQHPNP